jgi:hypothetical protein
MPSLLDPDEDQTLGQTGAGLLRIGQDDGSDPGAALAELYRRVSDYMDQPAQAQGDVTPRWDADNPVGTETTQTLRQATPIVSPERYQAHAQVQQALELAPMMGLGMAGGIREVPGGAAPGLLGSLEGRGLNTAAPGFNSRVSTRIPTAAGLDFNPHQTGDLQIGSDSILGTSVEPKVADRLWGYPDMPTGTDPGDHAAIIENSINHMKDNMRWIYDNMDPAVRDAAKVRNLWSNSTDAAATRNQIGALRGVDASAANPTRIAAPDWFTPGP